MGWRGLLRCARAGLGIVALLAIAGPWLLLPARWPVRRRLMLAAWGMLLAGFGIRVRVHGRPVMASGMLHVANHISWTDIPVLGRLLDAGFVAKGEVRGWPVIGRLTQAYGCIFVDRERRGRAGEQAEAVAAHLRTGHGLILFAEGTTGDGAAVLPFRTSLFALVPGADGGEAMVQPIAIRYRRRDGSPLRARERRAVAWMDDDELLTHALALAASGGLVAEVWFETPVRAEGRKALAHAARTAITARLRVLDEMEDAQAATLNLAA